MIVAKTYNTLLLLQYQLFSIEGTDYQIVQPLRECNGVEQEISYIFKRIPDTNGKRWEMSHERIDELERTNRIEYR